MDQRAMAAKQFAKNQVKKVTEYFKPTEKVRTRDFIREVPGAIAQTFSGTRDTVVKGGKILGEGLAYATSPNVRKTYQAGNTDILPTVSNTTPRQMLGNTAKSAFEVAPVGKIRGLATAAMSAKLAPRMMAGGAMGYGYGVADEMSKPEAISEKTYAGPNPVLSLLGGALFGGMSKPAATMLGQAGREIGDDIRNINPANRLSHKVVDKYDMEPVPGVFAPGGKQQMRPIMESFRKEVETTQMPFEPQSSIAKLLLGKQAPVGMSIKAVDDPLLQEARKAIAEGKTLDDFVKAQLKNDELVTVYRTSKSGVKHENIREGTYFTKNRDAAKEYLRGKDKIIEYKIPKSQLIPDRYSEEVIYRNDTQNPAISKLTDLWKKANQSSPDQYLLNEARKYKSAEEFVFNTKNLFRGTNDEGVNLLNAGNIPKEGLSMSLDPSIAKKYAQSRGLSGYTIEKNLLPNAKIITLDKVPNSIRSSGEGTDFAGKAAIWARKQGYDVLDMTRGNEVEMRILNKNVLTTKSQLTDLYHQATKE